MSKELIRLSDCFMKFDDDVILDHINLYINDRNSSRCSVPPGAAKPRRSVSSAAFRSRPLATCFLTA